MYDKVVKRMIDENWEINHFNTFYAIFLFIFQRHKKMVIISMLLSFFSTIMLAWVPKIMQTLIDSLIAKEMERSYELMLKMVIISVIQVIFHSIACNSFFNVACGTEDSLRGLSFDRYFWIDSLLTEEMDS